MKASKILAKVLFWVFRILFFAYLLVLTYALFALISGYKTQVSTDGADLVIQSPFGVSSLLNLENSFAYILFAFLMPMVLYVLFFFFTADVFRMFSRERLFLDRNVRYMKLYFRLNLFLPLPTAVLAGLFTEVNMLVWNLVFIHFILGIFTFFIAELFYRGSLLQNDQDLFI